VLHPNLNAAIQRLANCSVYRRAMGGLGRSTSALRSLLLLAAGTVVFGTAGAQGTEAQRVPPKQLSQAEVITRYQSCPMGYYSGPRPGKPRYTKDPWVWAVTPEFAAAFCMPPEFISRELTGVHAVAYKMTQNNDEIVCGWGENSEVCNTGTEHRFEIYYKTGTIPKERDAPYFHGAHLPSAMLISKSSASSEASSRRARELRRPGAVGVFAASQFGLMSIRGDKFAWPLGSLAPWIYFQEAMPGVDYIALEGGGGFSRNQNWIKHGSRELVITVRQIPDPSAAKRTDEMTFDQFALLIRLPTSISEQVIRNDQAKGIDLLGMAKRALGASAPTR
jgi:hypothetical protein